jgi:hypothetical protein
MRLWGVLALAISTFALFTGHPALAVTKTVIAEAQYVMADGDTLATAEEKVLQRAQRRAVEEAGVYLESTFYDVEQESYGRTTRNTSLEIRTIAAAITETEILDSRRSFENERPVFFIRIRASVDLHNLAEATSPPVRSSAGKAFSGTAVGEPAFARATRRLAATTVGRARAEH